MSIHCKAVCPEHGLECVIVKRSKDLPRNTKGVGRFRGHIHLCVSETGNSHTFERGRA